MVDANHAYNALEAIQLARAMEPYAIHWFEEPVPPEDLDGYMEVKRASRIPIAGGECEYTRYGFRELINRRVVDMLQPDLCAMGGFSEMLKVIAMASAANLPVIPTSGARAWAWRRPCSLRTTGETPGHCIGLHTLRSQPPERRTCRKRASLSGYGRGRITRPCGRTVLWAIGPRRPQHGDPTVRPAAALCAGVRSRFDLAL
jgi:hypothetical protein